MDAIRDLIIDIGHFADTPKGYVVIFLIVLPFVAWHPIRLFLAKRQDERALTIAPEVVDRQFRLAAGRAPVDGESPACAQYAEWVRLEDWDSLHRQLLRDDAARASDRDGTRCASIGVQAGLSAIYTAIGPGGAGNGRRVLEALAGFDDRLEQEPDNLAAAVLAAQARMEIGWMIRGGGTMDTVSNEAFAAMQHHFEVAADILRPFGVAKRGSAMLAAANFRLAVGLCENEFLFPAAQAIWSKADPTDPDMMRQVAFHLLPRWYGDYPDLHRAAAKIATETRAELGDQAYAIMLLSVAAEDPEVVGAADVERLIQGTEELIAARGNDQHVINHAVAGLFYMMQETAGARRTALGAAVRGLLETKLKTLIVDAWADPVAEVRKGLARLFSQELNAGATIDIDEGGFRISLPEGLGAPA